MKAIRLIGCLIILVLACGFTLQIGDSYRFKYLPLDSDGSLITGQYPELQIIKDATSQYYDFTHDTFVGSASADTRHVIDLVAGSWYEYTFTPPSAETSGATYSFIIKNYNATYLDSQVEEVRYEDVEGKIDTAITHLVGIKGTTWNSATDSLEAIRDRGDAAWLSCEASSFAGTGDTVVNEDYGGDDELAYKTGAGAGIDNATIIAYLKTDYDAGDKGAAFMKGVAKTDTAGAWENSLQLDCGYTYTIVFYKQGYYGPDTQEVTVTCP